MQKVLKSSRIKSFCYRVFYNFRSAIIGVHPRTRIFHPQYLVNEHLRKIVKSKFICRLSENGHVKILDVGCGSKPYQYLAPSVDWFGIDIIKGPNVDLVIDKSSKWALDDNTFDAILCTEVLEHAVNPELVIDEIWRVLKPNGIALITSPFVYGVHGEPSDFRRYTQFGLVKAADKFQVLEFGMLGGIGSAIGVCFNSWLTVTLYRNVWLRIITIPLSWILFSATNLLSKIFDFIDTSYSFGTNTWIAVCKC